MKIKLLMFVVGMCFLLVSGLRADELEMQNGNRYFGKVISVSTDDVVLDSEILGEITVPRKKVSRLALGTNTAAPQFVNRTNVAAARAESFTNNYQLDYYKQIKSTNQSLAAAFQSLGASKNFIHQIRDQMLAGNPDASSRYDQMVKDLLNGRLDMDDLRHQAQASANQIRELKRELGSDAGDSLDGYLEVLNQFLSETTNEPSNNINAMQTQLQKP